jgi:hypothetical protein
VQTETRQISRESGWAQQGNNSRITGKEQGDSRRRKRGAASDALEVVSPSSEGAAPLTGPRRGRAKAPLNATRPFSNQLNALIYLKTCGSSWSETALVGIREFVRLSFPANQRSGPESKASERRNAILDSRSVASRPPGMTADQSDLAAMAPAARWANIRPETPSARGSGAAGLALDCRRDGLGDLARDRVPRRGVGMEPSPMAGWAGLIRLPLRAG